MVGWRLDRGGLVGVGVKGWWAKWMMSDPRGDWGVRMMSDPSLVG